MAEGSEKRPRRVPPLAVMLILLLAYGASYGLLRRTDRLVHIMWDHGGRIQHSIEVYHPISPSFYGRAVFEIKRLFPYPATSYIVNALPTSEHTCLLVVFAPLRWVEAWYWERTDP